MAAGNSFGDLYRITTYGESHGPMVGVVIDGCPSGIELSMEKIQKEMDRRKPGQSKATTQRKEADIAHIASGFIPTENENIVITTGHPIHLYCLNTNFKSEKYEPIKHNFRPSHADYTYWKKYGVRDYKGGGRSSGRETVGRVLAGAVAKQVLEELTPRRAYVCGFTVNIGGLEAEYKGGYPSSEKNILRWPEFDENLDKALKMLEEAKANHQSLGGAIEVYAEGMLAGLGEPVFDKLNAALMYALGSIGAVKAVQIGIGTKVESMRGSEYRDIKKWMDKGNRKEMGYLTNNAGGIEGGISTRENIVARLSVKPTPTVTETEILMPNENEENEVKIIHGDHDPTIMPRMVPVAESMMAITLLDFLLKHRAYQR